MPSPWPGPSRPEAQLERHLVEQRLEGEAHVHGAVTAHRTARWRVGEHPLAAVAHVLDVVEGVEQGAGVQDRDDPVAAVRAAALHRLAVDGDDASVAVQPELHTHRLRRPAAVGDEVLFARRHQTDPRRRGARQQRADDLDVEGLGAAAEAAADVRLHHADARAVQPEAARQHQVHVVGHLRRAVHGKPFADRVVLGERGVGLHLHLAHFRAGVALLTHQVGALEGRIHLAQLVAHLPLDVAGALVVQIHCVGGAGRVDVEVGRDRAHPHPYQPEGGVRSSVVHRRHRRHRLAAIAHPVARQRILAHGDRQDTEGRVAVRAGDHRQHPGQRASRLDIDVEDLRVRVGAAVDAAHQRLGLQEIGGVASGSGDLLRAVDHRHVGADDRP
jgi:hypothetical protein